MLRRTTFFCVGAFLALFIAFNTLLADELNFVRDKTERLQSMEPGFTMQTEWMLANYPDSVRYPNKLGFEASATIVTFPESVRGLYFKRGIDPLLAESYIVSNVVDSFVSGDHVLPLAEDTDLAGVIVDSQLLACLYRNEVQYLARRIGSSTPSDTFSVYTDGESRVQDLSVYWLVQFPDSAEIDAIIPDLQAVVEVGAVCYVPVIRPFGDEPPDPPQANCQWVNDLSYRQYHLFPPDSMPGGIDAYGAWDLLCETWAVQSSDFLVGICDNGFGTAPEFHPDFWGNVSPLSNVQFPTQLQDVHGGHGTAVAGVFGASAIDMPRSSAGKLAGGIYTGGGVIGVSPKTKMVLTDRGDGGDEYENMLSDLKYLIDTCKVDLINMSWGYYVADAAIEALLQRAFYQRGIVLVAAAGNCDMFTPCPHIVYPAALPYVIATSSCDSIGEIAWDNWGPFVDLVAPGKNVYTTGGISKLFNPDVMNYLYSTQSGTSMASPIVCGTAALVKTAQPGISGATIYDILTRSCDPVPGFTTYPNNYVGYGKVNARKAVERVINGLHCDGIAGDVNTDCYVNWADCLLLRKYMIGDTTLPQPNNADVDGDCMIDISDFAALVSFVLNGGPVPVSGCVEGLANSVEEKEVALPLLKNAYPNPCNPSSTISYDLPKACPVKVTIFNLLGEVVNVLQDGRQEAGAYTVSWNGQNLKGETVSSGIYLYQLRAGEYTATRKLALLK